MVSARVWITLDILIDFLKPKVDFFFAVNPCDLRACVRIALDIFIDHEKFSFIADVYVWRSKSLRCIFPAFLLLFLGRVPRKQVSLSFSLIALINFLYSLGI